MKTWANKDSFHESLADSMMKKSADAELPPLQFPANVSEWLGKISLLYGVPLEYLVPDSRMLPPESMRYFYLDRNWIDRLIDGAMSVGVLSTKDQIFNKAFFSEVYTAADVAQQNTRNIIRGEKSVVPKTIGGTITGLLIRSRVVSDFPGVEITASVGEEANKKELKLLRMDRLSETMIICLFDGVPENVTFKQPAEGLHFGIPEFDPDNPANNFIKLRGLGFNGWEGGVQIDPKGNEQYMTAQVPFTETKGVVDITKLVGNIKTQFDTLPEGKNPLGDLKNLTAGAFAIQMVVTQGVQEYKLKVKDGSAPKKCNVDSN